MCKMARMYSRDKGKSGSKKPLSKAKKTWVRYSAKEIEQLIIKFAESGLAASQIGIVLRDIYGVPDVKQITKKKINKILKENKLIKEIPSDLINLIKKDILLIKHFEENKHDMGAKRGIQLTESKINRLIKYYKKNNILASDWAYDRKRAKLLVG